MVQLPVSRAKDKSNNSTKKVTVGILLNRENDVTNDDDTQTVEQMKKQITHWQ